MRVAVAALAVVPLVGISFRSPSRDATPPARAHHALAYDPVARRVVLTGGSTPRDSGRSFEFFNDLWAFDGRRWIGDTWGWTGREWRRLSDDGPAPRGMGQLAYDAARDRVVLFGGRRGYPNGDLADTWEWDGTRWTRFGD